MNRKRGVNASYSNNLNEVMNHQEIIKAGTLLFAQTSTFYFSVDIIVSFCQQMMLILSHSMLDI